MKFVIESHGRSLAASKEKMKEKREEREHPKRRLYRISPYERD
jgi:hypothetical protein